MISEYKVYDCQTNAQVRAWIAPGKSAVKIEKDDKKREESKNTE